MFYARIGFAFFMIAGVGCQSNGPPLGGTILRHATKTGRFPPEKGFPTVPPDLFAQSPDHISLSSESRAFPREKPEPVGSKGLIDPLQHQTGPFIPRNSGFAGL
jgi:hypothetical protein